MKRFGWRIFLLGMALMMAIPVLGGCVYRGGGRIVHLSDEMKHETVRAQSDSDSWRIEIERLSFSGGGDPVIRVIPSEEAHVEAHYPAELDDYGFEITVKGGVIHIATDYHYSYAAGAFEVTVYANFDQIELSGGCNLDVDASGMERVKLDISGASDLTIKNLSAKRFEIDLSGAADITASGTAERAVIGVSGASDIDARELVCREADVRLSGAGNLVLSVTELLDARVSGVGSVSYYGSPAVSSNVSGVGEIKQRSETVYEK